jgi:ferrous-iron efflux pump FieF
MNATSELQLRRWSSYASFTVAVLLVIAKATAWFVTDSLSLLASLVDAVKDTTPTINNRSEQSIYPTQKSLLRAEATP